MTKMSIYNSPVPDMEMAILAREKQIDNITESINHFWENLQKEGFQFDLHEDLYGALLHMLAMMEKRGRNVELP